MSRKLTVVLLAMLVLVGAMSLKTVVVTHGDGSVIMANGSAPLPPTPWKNGSAPLPPTPWKYGRGFRKARLTSTRKNQAVERLKRAWCFRIRCMDPWCPARTNGGGVLNRQGFVPAIPGHQRLHVGGIFRQHRTLQDPLHLWL